MLDKNEFRKKYIFYFNIYGNILIIFSICIIIVSISLFNIVSIILLVLAITSIGFGIKITFGYKKKYQYYRVTEKGILKNGYSDDYFEWGFTDPCYRLLSKQILIDIGKRSNIIA